MKELKEEFSFSYNKKTVQVKKLGKVWCAVAGKTAKSLKISFCEGVHIGKICTQEGKFLAWLPKQAIKVISNDEILRDLKDCVDFEAFLVFIRDSSDLNLVMDGNWSWVEYRGKSIEGTEKERFINSTELEVLLKIAGL